MGALAQNGQASRLAQRSPLQGLFGIDPFQAIVANWDYGFEVTRTENGYLVEVPVPGFNSSSVEITLKDGIVSVNAKNERRTFSRSFTVPEDVDSEKISASVVDGMLSIALERHPAAQPKRIIVK
jgi:HSP20 family molecular chaperone IbpA